MNNMFQGCGEMNDASVDFSSWCVYAFRNGEPSNFPEQTDITEAPAWNRDCASLPETFRRSRSIG